jgi:hypothetical protein
VSAWYPCHTPRFELFYLVPRAGQLELIIQRRTGLTGTPCFSPTESFHPSDPTHSDQSAPQPTYPPPSNGVAAAARAPNPYAQQNVGGGQQGGNYGGGGGYGAPQAYGQNAGNPYAQQQYGQQEQYAMGGGGAAQGEDFWSELSSTNALLSQLQEQIQAVRSAHQQSLVSRRRQPDTDTDTDTGQPVGVRVVRYTDIPSRRPTLRPRRTSTSSTTRPAPCASSARTTSRSCSSSPRATGR